MQYLSDTNMRGAPGDELAITHIRHTVLQLHIDITERGNLGVSFPNCLPDGRCCPLAQLTTFLGHMYRRAQAPAGLEHRGGAPPP